MMTREYKPGSAFVVVKINTISPGNASTSIEFTVSEDLAYHIGQRFLEDNENAYFYICQPTRGFTNIKKSD
jgi:hypothetical protein